MEQLLKILREIRPEIDFEHEDKLVSGGVLDSFDIISIVSDINDTFDINIPVEDLMPENFDTVQAMLRLIEALKSDG